MNKDKKALLIGINYIGMNGELKGCINDCENVRKWLIQEYQYEPDSIVVLSELSDHQHLKPTKSNILYEMKRLVKDATEGCYRFIGYSGHGGSQPDLSNDESDGKDETICPIDYQINGVIIDDTIREILINKMPKNSYLHGIFDSCHSGTIADLKYRCVSKSSYPNLCNYDLVTLNNPVTDAFVCILSGCRDNQTSSDVVVNKTGFGALTLCFLKSYDKNKAMNKVTYKNMIKSVSIILKDKKHTQIPQLSFGQFIDINKSFIC